MHKKTFLLLIALIYIANSFCSQAPFSLLDESAVAVYRDYIIDGKTSFTFEKDQVSCLLEIEKKIVEVDNLSIANMLMEWNSPTNIAPSSVWAKDGMFISIKKPDQFVIDKLQSHFSSHKVLGEVSNLQPTSATTKTTEDHTYNPITGTATKILGACALIVVILGILQHQFNIFAR